MSRPRYRSRATRIRGIAAQRRMRGFASARRGGVYSSPYKRPRRTFQAGRSRTGGFYGRYPGETKFHDIDVDDNAIAVGANIQNSGSVNLIPQGVTEKTRVGRKCTISGINWRLKVGLPSLNGVGTAPLGDNVRVIMYLDKQCNGATAATTDILESADFQSFNNLANTSRFKTLMDRTYSMSYQAGAGSGGAADNDWAAVQNSDTFFKKCNIPIEFDNTTGALTEIRSNNIGVMLLSETGEASFESKIRLRFSDGS